MNTKSWKYTFSPERSMLLYINNHKNLFELMSCFLSYLLCCIWLITKASRFFSVRKHSLFLGLPIGYLLWCPHRFRKFIHFLQFSKNTQAYCTTSLGSWTIRQKMGGCDFYRAQQSRGLITRYSRKGEELRVKYPRGRLTRKCLTSSLEMKVYMRRVENNRAVIQ